MHEWGIASYMHASRSRVLWTVYGTVVNVALDQPIGVVAKKLLVMLKGFLVGPLLAAENTTAVIWRNT